MQPPPATRRRPPLTRLLALVCAPALAAGLLSASAPDPASAQQAAPLGAHYDASGENITFGVYSSAATRMELYVYAAAQGEPEKLVRELEADGDVFGASVSLDELAEAGVGEDVYYGYRAWGPNWEHDAQWSPGSEAGFVSDVDASGNRFNPNKLLLDPYAREVSHDPTGPDMTDRTVYASGPQHRAVDSGPVAPKGIVLRDASDNTAGKPTGAFKDDVVYEVHVKGLTQNDDSVPADLRGTYKGAAAKAEYLAGLGVTAVEFLPTQETPNDRNDIDPDSSEDSNYWGYETLNYFSPDRRYSSDKSPGGPTAEYQAMVRAFHDAGLKVIADVVYNHTGEGGPWDASDKNTYNVMSFRGLDNPTYYSLSSDRQEPWDNTGVGGNVNTYNPVTQDLIVDSLRYWRDVLGVDGFRHDLAPVLGNTCEHGCFRYDRDDPNTALNAITAALPPRPAGGGEGVDWIAEPWALGDGTYQVGNFPSGWSEWNDKYRDTLRSDQNQLGDEDVTPGQLATRFAGSSDLYDERTPAASVNFMVAHDGFTLADLYACNEKNNNQPWPYGPSDGGSDSNRSWDQGGDPAAQRQAARNGMAFLALSAGTPMLTGGDEHLRGMRCNNNPYNVDSEANWLDWSPDADASRFSVYTGRMLQFRADHPSLRPADFYSGDDGNANGFAQLEWYTPAGAAPDDAYWNDPGSHALGWRIDGAEFDDPYDAIYVGYNGWSDAVDFTLPDPGDGLRWHRAVDTSASAEGDDQVALPGEEELVDGDAYQVDGRSLFVLIAR
ncbi:MAG: glycogen debranching protein [Stackebrandtia sp.]